MISIGQKNIGKYIPVDHIQGCTIFWQNKKSENFFSFGSHSAFRLHCLLVGLNSYEQQLPSSAQLRQHLEEKHNWKRKKSMYWLSQSRVLLGVAYSVHVVKSSPFYISWRELEPKSTNMAFKQIPLHITVKDVLREIQ